MDEKKLEECAGMVLEKIKNIGHTEKSVKNLGDAVAVLQETVAEIQGLGFLLTLSNQEKHAIAVRVINRVVDIPYVPEFLEEKMIDFAVGLVVEFVKQLAAKYGKRVWVDALNVEEKKGA